MNDDKLVIRAACHCGNFKVDVPVSRSSLPLPGSICHCDSCRHASGALCYTCLLPLQEPEWIPEPALIARLRGHASSDAVTRYFCPTCSCHVLFHDSEQQDWHLTSGCLEQIEGIVDFKRHIFIKDTTDGGSSDWLSDNSLQRSATFTDELEVGWRKPEPQPTVDSSERLHAHCLCKGVEFYIARPSPSSEQTSAPWPDVLVPHNSGPANDCVNETWWLRADKKKFLGGICACDSCRLMSGFEYTNWAFIPASDISLDPDGKVPCSREFGTLQAYRSSDIATKRFCGRCGATVFYDGDSRPGLLDVAAGLLDAPEGARAESWLEWRTERVSYREDAEPRAKSILSILEKGLRKWGEDVEGRQGPHERFLTANNGDIQ